MSLTFGLKTPRDLLEKAYRELAILEAAALMQDETQLADALFNFAVTTYHVKDWLEHHFSASRSSIDVDAYVARQPALLVCRDLCNAGKHVVLEYKPVTEAVLASTELTPDGVAMEGSPGAPNYRVVVARKDGSTLDVVALANQALNDWERFFALHKMQSSAPER
jgi:hypothetical protein